MVSLVGQQPRTGMFRCLPGKPDAVEVSSRNETTTDARLEEPNFEELVDDRGQRRIHGSRRQIFPDCW